MSLTQKIRANDIKQKIAPFKINRLFLMLLVLASPLAFSGQIYSGQNNTVVPFMGTVLLDLHNRTARDLGVDSDVKFFIPDESSRSELAFAKGETNLTILDHKISSEALAIARQRQEKIWGRVIAQVPIALIVNQDNQTAGISLWEVAGILSCRIRDWSQLNDSTMTGEIHFYVGATRSVLIEFLIEATGVEPGPCLILSKSSKDNVISDPRGLALGTITTEIPYSRLRLLGVAPGTSRDYVPLFPYTVRDGQYPLTGKFYVYRAMDKNRIERLTPFKEYRPKSETPLQRQIEDAAISTFSSMTQTERILGPNRDVFATNPEVYPWVEAH